MEMPEKIWISPSIDLPKLNGVLDKDCVEYTRTDAFIKKATKWLIDNIQDYTDDGMGKRSFVLVQDLKEDFKKYMEE